MTVRLVTGYDHRGLPFARYERVFGSPPADVVGNRFRHIVTVQRKYGWKTRCGALIPFRKRFDARRGVVLCPRCADKRRRDFEQRMPRAYFAN